MPNTKETSCPICKLEAQHVEMSDGGERLNVACLRCGRFRVTGTAAAMARKRNIGPELSAWIRERSEIGVEWPEISSTSLNDIASNLPTYSAGQKQLLLLRAIARNSSFPGKTVPLASDTDFPLAWASGREEFAFYAQSLIDRGLLRHTTDRQRAQDAPLWHVALTSDGWDYLDQQARTSTLSDQGFVAMSFSDAMRPIWEVAIRSAISKAGYKAYRIDAEPHTERIDVKLMAEIRASRLLVADVTEHKQGVYFEAGYALGLGLPVIWTVREDDLGKAHFDTRQYNHLVWKSAEEFREQLFFFVCATVGKRNAA